MDSIRIKNFRSIEDSGEIKINKINLLLGENSSGKSSFLRLFPMMKDTSNNELRGPLLWFNDDYDFGGFINSLYRKATIDKDTISFIFSWTAVDKELGPKCEHCTMFDRSPLGFLCSSHYTVSFLISLVQDNTICKEIEIRTDKHTLNIITDKDTLFLSFKIDGKPFKTKPAVWKYDTIGIIPNLSFNEGYSPIRNIRKLIDRNLSDSERYLADDFYSLFSSKSCDIKEIYKHITSDRNPFTRLLSKFLKEHKEQSDAICKDVILSNIIHSLQYVDRYLTSSFEETFYMTPIRFSFGRYIRNKDLSVDYIDPNGKNVMEFILSLDKDELKQYNTFLKDTLKIKVTVIGKENKSIMVEDANGEKYNIVDVGYGFTQILPVATILWDRARVASSCEFPYIVEIEQPEVHLHPHMQANLANLFVEAIKLSKINKSNLELIIETHSSVLINSLGRIVRNSNKENRDLISNNDISVYLFEKKNGTTQITSTEFDEKGRINRWPIGFLD